MDPMKTARLYHLLTLNIDSNYNLQWFDSLFSNEIYSSIHCLPRLSNEFIIYIIILQVYKYYMYINWPFWNPARSSRQNFPLIRDSLLCAILDCTRTQIRELIVICVLHIMLPWKYRINIYSGMILIRIINVSTKG